jgi:hypothetical protein
MKAVEQNTVAAHTPEVKLFHRDETLTFSISVFGRKNFQNDLDVFEHINQYWESLDMKLQDQIFNTYKDISYAFDNIWGKNELTEFLSDKIQLLMSYHDLDAIQDWLVFRSNIIIPTSFEVDYSSSIDNNTSREKTYTRSDYVQLITLSLCLRTMIPIWGEHIASTRRDTGTTYKEFYSFQLLNKSDIVNSVPMEKLKIYIDHIVGNDKFNPNNTLKGISSEDFGYWLLSLVCIRRLCIGDIRGVDPKSNLITYVYKYIIQKVQNNDNNFENVVKEKRIDDKGSMESENKLSSLERYKIKTNISPGEIVELEFSLRDIHSAVRKLTCMADEELLERSLQTSSVLINERILDPQMILLRWVFKPVISPRGLMYLPLPMIVRALGALEAVLWARGHKYLALIATAHSVSSDKEMIVSPVDSKMRVSKEYSDELDRLYPYTKTSQSKKLGTKSINLAARSIDNVTDNLMMFSWKPTAHPSMVEEVLGSNIRRLPIKPDIKTDLTKLVIDLGNRNWL